MENQNANAEQIQFELLEPEAGTNFWGAVAYENGKEVDRVADVSTDRAALKEFLDLCNQNQISLCHFRDVISDFNASETMVCWF